MSHKIERIHRQPKPESLPYDAYAGEDETHIFEDGVNPFEETPCENPDQNPPHNHQ